MISKTLILLWLCGTLFLSTVGVGFYAIQQTVRIASLTAELTNSATELAATKAAHKKSLSEQKAKLKAKARLRRGLIAVPFIGAALIIYFEEQDFQEWLNEHPQGNRTQYACEVATYSAEIIDELVADTLMASENLPNYIQPDAEKVKTWMEVPKCKEE